MNSTRTALIGLVSGASLLALSAPAAAQTILFSTGITPSGGSLAARPLAGQQTVSGGVTQIRMQNGAIIAFVGDATFEVDGASVRVQAGSFTVRAGQAPLQILSPDGTSVMVALGSSASLAVVDGGLSGRALEGSVATGTGSGTRRFAAGQPFTANGRGASAIVTAGAQPVSAPVAQLAETENPLLPTYRQGPRAEVLGQLLEGQGGALGLDFETVSPAFADVNLAYLRAGGTPGGFSDAIAGTALQQYLAALRAGNAPAGGAALADAYLDFFAADGVAALTAQQRAIIDAYTRIIAAGGSPGAFNDAAIGTAYSNYIRQLATGAQTGLSPAVAAAYEAYIRSLGLGDTFDAGRRAQIEAFQKLQAAGGSASAVAGVEAIDRYLAYLAAGGVAANYPGGSTGLISAYLDYLRAIGIPDGVDPAAVARLLAFYAHLAGGGSIGTLPTRPVDPEPEPEPEPPVIVPPVTTAATYAGAFVGRAGATSYGGDAGPVAVEVDAGGYPRTLRGDIRIGTARLADAAKGAGWVIGRYTDGSVTTTTRGVSSEATLSPGESLHFAFGTSYVPFTGNRGSARYQIAAFTTPTYADSSAVTAASLTGTIQVQFGSQLKYGLEGTLTTTAAGQAQRYDFSTAGGAAALSVNGSAVANGFYLFGQAPVTSTDPRCGTGCRFIPNMFGSGSDGQVIAGTYALAGTTAVLTGAAVFTQASRDASAVVTPVTPPAPTGSGAPTGTVEFVGIGPFTELNGTSVQTPAVAAADGKLESIRNNGRGTNLDREHGGLAGVIGWTRWSGGTTQALVAGRGTATIAENGGQHMVWGKQVTNLPTSGTATYALAGSTKPTVADGSVAPGSVSAGSLAVDFASMRVGYDLSVQFGGSTYALGSRGGAAAPSVAITTGGRFTSSFRDADGPVLSGNGCTGTTCYAQVFGFLAGSGASHAGLTYNFLSGPSGSVVSGAAVFGKTP